MSRIAAGHHALKPPDRSAVFVVDATNAGSGTVSNKTYESGTAPASKVLTAFESDDDSVTIHVELDAGPAGSVGRGWQPVVTIHGGDADVEVTNLTPIVTDVRRFSGSATISASSSGGIYATTNDAGNSSVVTYTRALNPPEILSVAWDDQGSNPDPYPGVQTQFGNNQNMQLSGTCDTHADEVWIKDAGATAGQGLQGPYVASGGTWTAANVKSGNATDATAHVVAYCKVTGGTNGDDFNSETDQAAATVICDQTSPTFGSPSHVYPGSQEALKNTETDTVTLTHTNPAAGDTYQYDDNSTGELTIPATTTYAASKALQRLSGDYRESGVNYRLTATRTAKNGHSATGTTTVRIAHVAPVITVDTWSSLDGTNATRLRTDDGTNGYYDHQIRLKADQARLSTDTPEIQGPPVGTFQGSWVQQSTTEYRRDLRVADGDFVSGGQAANTYAWNGSTTVSWVNRAGIEATTVTTGDALLVGGFENRTIAHDVAPDHEMLIGCLVVDTSKLVAVNTSKGGSPTQVFKANITEHNDADPDNNNFFTISNGSDVYDADGGSYHNSDKKFADTVTDPLSSVIDLQETA